LTPVSNPSAAATWCSLLAEIFLLLFFFDIIDWWVLYVRKHHNLISSFKTEQFSLPSTFQFDTSCHNYIINNIPFEILHTLSADDTPVLDWTVSTQYYRSCWWAISHKTFFPIFIFSDLHLPISRVSTHFKQNSIFNVFYVSYEDTILELVFFHDFAHELIHGFIDELLFFFLKNIGILLLAH